MQNVLRLPSQNILILPTYDRPEMLWLCLEHLAACPEIHEVQIRVYVDAHVGQPPPPRAEIDAVVEKFPQLSIQRLYRQAHGFPGNSFNLLNAYKDAYETNAAYVFMVEDDVMVHPTFFEWHLKQHTAVSTRVFPLGCSIAVVNEPQYGVYASLGVCFQRERLTLILPHCRPEYFQDVRGYCRFHFPPSKSDCEQDGLFCRVLADNYTVVWAETPLAQHVGWYGYHRRRSIRPTGSLEARFGQVKRALANPDILRKVVRDFGDIKLLQLSAGFLSEAG